MSRYKLRHLRRGTSATQWVVFVALITLVLIGTVKLIGTESNEHLKRTSGGLGDPNDLVNIID